MNGSELDSVEKLLDDSIVYINQRNPQKAGELLERVLEIRTKEFGEDALSVGLTFYYIGNVLRMEERFDEALEKLNRALAILMKESGENHAYIVNTYELLGRVFLQQGNYEKAEEMCRKVVDLQGGFHAQESNLMDLSQNLALSLQMQGKFSEAIKIQKVVLVKLLQIHGEDHPDVVLVYIAIAGLLKGQKRLDDAHQMLDKSIEICYRLQELGDDFDTVNLVRALRTKAGLLEEQGNMEGSTEMLHKVTMVQKESLGEMHPSTAEAYEKLAVAYAKREMQEDGINALNKALEFRQTVLGEDHPDTKKVVGFLIMLNREKIAKALRLQGLALNAKGDSAMAIRLFHEALDVYKEIYTAHPKMATVYESIATVKVEQGLLEDGIAASAEALKIRRKMQGDDDTDTKGRMEAHRSLLKRLLENRNEMRELR
ncbi:unnamed protein product [Cylindrotheca closterium]|uniref:Kinesin light chain n=1 Tax=Cylindrotheca closterium TaxID=2856 RepID=A0AAD2JGM8_9STRA|nr:unnamed protein product [Cylindrotheca closterium]